MTDIVERLRKGKTDGTALTWTVTPIHLEAADEIERLRWIIDAVHPQMQARIDKLEVELAEVAARVEAARREGIKAAIEQAAQYPEENGACRHTAAGLLGTLRALLEDKR